MVKRKKIASPAPKAKAKSTKKAKSKPVSLKKIVKAKKSVKKTSKKKNTPKRTAKPSKSPQKAAKNKQIAAIPPVEIAPELSIIPDHIDPDIEAFAAVAQDIAPIVTGVVKKKNYLNNKDLMAQVMMSKQYMQMNNVLAHMLQTLCKRYAKKGNFANYSYNEDMQGYAMLMLVKTWHSFNPAKSNNPFAFFTQCIKNSFIQYLNQERKQRDVKNGMLVDSGFNPSHSYMLDYEARGHEPSQSSDDIVDPSLLPPSGDMNVDKVTDPSDSV